MLDSRRNLPCVRPAPRRGSNTAGQLGAAVGSSSAVPVPVSGSPDFADVTFSLLSAGSDFTCGTAPTNSENWCCECLGAQEPGQPASPVTPGSGCCAAGGAGGCTAPRPAQKARSRPHPQASRQAPLGISPRPAAAAGGAGNRGQLGNNGDSDSAEPVKVAGSQTFVSVDAGGAHACALDSLAMAWCW